MPAQNRLGDSCTGHPVGCPPRPAVGASPNVIVNGKGAVRLSDPYAVHCGHPGSVASGSPNVIVNGLQTARVGDPIDCGSSIAQGSPDVFINDL